MNIPKKVTEYPQGQSMAEVKGQGILATLKSLTKNFHLQLAVYAGLGVGCVNVGTLMGVRNLHQLQVPSAQNVKKYVFITEENRERMTLEQAYMLFITNLLRQNNPLIVDFDRLDEPVEEAAQANPSNEAINEEEAVEGEEGPRYRFDVIPYETLSLPPVEVPEMTLVGRGKEVKDRYLEEHGAIEYTLAMLNDIYDLPETEIERIRAVFLGFKQAMIEWNEILQENDRKNIEEYILGCYERNEDFLYGFHGSYTVKLSHELSIESLRVTLSQLDDSSLIKIAQLSYLELLLIRYADIGGQNANTPLDFFREENPEYDCNVISTIRYILAWELGIKDILFCLSESITTNPDGHAWLVVPLQKKDGTEYYWYHDNLIINPSELFQNVLKERYQNIVSTPLVLVYSNFDEALTGVMQVEINNYNYELVFRETSDGRSLLDYLPHLDVRESYFNCQKALALDISSINLEVNEGFIIHAFLSAVYVLRNEAISRRLYEKLTPFIKEAMVNKLGGTRYLPQEGE